jgi:hypothetical protein
MDNANESKTGKPKFSDSISDDNTNGKKQHKRFYRFGAGHEETSGKGDTPGFECNTSPTITQVLIPQVRPAHKYPISPWEMIHLPGGDNATGR